MPALTKILLIEDSLAQARLLQELLKGVRAKEFLVAQVQRLSEALTCVQQEDFDVILLDLTLPDSQVLASLSLLNYCASSIPVVVLTYTNDERLALKAVRQGAQDYLLKWEVNESVLIRSLCYAIERKQAAETLRLLNQTLSDRVQADG